jgi:hypothetical protein
MQPKKIKQKNNYKKDKTKKIIIKKIKQKNNIKKIKQKK